MEVSYVISLNIKEGQHILSLNLQYFVDQKRKKNKIRSASFHLPHLCGLLGLFGPMLYVFPHVVVGPSCLMTSAFLMEKKKG